jgi:hypothetical protein
MWNKFKEGLREGLQNVDFESIYDVLIAVGVVYFLAWIVGQPVGQVVGWVALAIAATSKR